MPQPSAGPILPTGEQYEIRADDFAAQVTEVGATLRTLTHRGRDLISGFAAEELPGKPCRGQQLAPWPNRIRDGRYVFGDTEQQLALNEPERGNAIHGLVRYVAWNLVEHRDDEVVQATRVYPQPGWPGTFETSIRHRVSASGLTVEVSARNIGPQPLPFGYAAHPYLTVGEDRVDGVIVTVPAGLFLEVDERLLPRALVPVSADTDLRVARRLEDRAFDNAFTGLDRGADGQWRVRLEREDRWTEIWAESGLDWVQVFTGDPYRTWGIAVEPMTCGPDAFNPGPTHDGLIVLEPGEERTYRWGITGG
jgi:aldose 1-epimerase